MREFVQNNEMKQNIINSLKGRQINSEADASKDEKKLGLMCETTPNLLRTLTYLINKSSIAVYQKFLLR